MRTAGDRKPLVFTILSPATESRLRLLRVAGGHRVVPTRSCGITCNNFSKQLKA